MQLLMLQVKLILFNPEIINILEFNNFNTLKNDLWLADESLLF